MLTYPCNVDPLTPHFYTVKLGLQGYTLFAYFCFLSKNKKNITMFHLKIIVFIAFRNPLSFSALYGVMRETVNKLW